MTSRTYVVSPHVVSDRRRPEARMKRRAMNLLLSALGVACMIFTFIMISHALFNFVALFK